MLFEESRSASAQARQIIFKRGVVGDHEGSSLFESEGEIAQFFRQFLRCTNLGGIAVLEAGAIQEEVPGLVRRHFVQFLWLANADGLKDMSAGRKKGMTFRAGG